MKRAGEARGALAHAASGSPVLFERVPHRPPVLRGRLHDHFLDILRDQPLGQFTQIGRRRADLLLREVKVAVDFAVGHDDRQHLLVDVNSRDPVRHRALLRERRACLVVSVRVASCRGAQASPYDAQSFDQSRTLRTKQLFGLHGSTGSIRSRRSRSAIVTPRRFSWAFAGRRPRLTSCGVRPARTANSKPSTPQTLQRIDLVVAARGLRDSSATFSVTFRRKYDRQGP